MFSQASVSHSVRGGCMPGPKVLLGVGMSKGGGFVQEVYL